MSLVLSRRIAIHSLAAAAADALTSARGATPSPASQPGSVNVPHFGKAGVKSCVPRARERIKSIMNGAGAERFNDQPRGTNSLCR